MKLTVWVLNVRGAAAFNNDTGGRAHAQTGRGRGVELRGERMVMMVVWVAGRGEERGCIAGLLQCSSSSGCVALGALACIHRKGHPQHFNNTQLEIPNCCTTTARSSLRRCAHSRPRALTGPVRRLLATRPPFTRTLQTPQTPPSHMQYLLAGNNTVSL